MPLHAIEPRRLYRQIADQLRQLIEQGEYPVGARMPPERDLASQMGVSRPSLREAMIALEIEGLVEVRTGSGVYVLARDQNLSDGPVTAEGPLEIIRARQTLESELAAQAARNPSAAHLAALHHSLRLMQQEADIGGSSVQGDRLLHLTIAEAADNSVLLRIVTELFDERSNPLFAQLTNYFETPAIWAVAISEHRAIVAAIERRDPAGARQAMHDHLDRSFDRLSANWTQAEGVAASRSSKAPLTSQ
ncbi:FadR family transcriptional regulator [Pigmentiphaga aceris]|uniref:FadR family transcriptional regulator n=1 Tax=Pigmentiphaga aceris TaxID=1940612 RepID=A0A5C0B7T2_9BURK|nr:FadR/GntR family transcriptional regulator [Pigmentiphaga aceris]QEI08837.1 FadR family transcriptional regulator [Pigmentiphaga aceris]